MFDGESRRFIWDEEKERLNILKHGVSFHEAMRIFEDAKIIIFIDEAHSTGEDRFFAVGKAGERILTVRFTYRDKKIRIFGAGEWRKGRKRYEEEQK